MDPSSSSALSFRAARSAGVLLLLLAAAVAGCTAPPKGPSRAAAENEILARTLLSAWEAGDPEVLEDLFRPDAVYDDFANAAQHRGMEEVLGYLTGIHRWAGDVVVNVTAVHPWDGGAAAEWILSGRHTGPLPGWLAEGTGREFILNGVTIIETEGGRIRRAADYFDALPLALQLGGAITFPEGSTLRLP